MNSRTNNFKKLKLAHRIQNCVNQFMRSGVNNPSFQFVSITKVNLNIDNTVASLYWDTFDDSKKDEIQSAIIALKGKIKKMLGENLKLRKTPQVIFKYDSQYNDELNIEKLINQSKTSLSS